MGIFDFLGDLRRGTRNAGSVLDDVRSQTGINIGTGSRQSRENSRDRRYEASEIDSRVDIARSQQELDAIERGEDPRNRTSRSRTRIERDESGQIETVYTDRDTYQGNPRGNREDDRDQPTTPRSRVDGELTGAEIRTALQNGGYSRDELRIFVENLEAATDKTLVRTTSDGRKVVDFDLLAETVQTYADKKGIDVRYLEAGNVAAYDDLMTELRYSSNPDRPRSTTVPNRPSSPQDQEMMPGSSTNPQQRSRSGNQPQTDEQNPDVVVPTERINQQPQAPVRLDPDPALSEKITTLIDELDLPQEQVDQLLANATVGLERVGVDVQASPVDEFAAYISARHPELANKIKNAQNQTEALEALQEAAKNLKSEAERTSEQQAMQDMSENVEAPEPLTPQEVEHALRTTDRVNDVSEIKKDLNDLLGTDMSTNDEMTPEFLERYAQFINERTDPRTVQAVREASGTDLNDALDYSRRKLDTLAEVTPGLTMDAAKALVHNLNESERVEMIERLRTLGYDDKPRLEENLLDYVQETVNSGVEIPGDLRDFLKASAERRDQFGRDRDDMDYNRQADRAVDFLKNQVTRDIEAGRGVNDVEVSPSNSQEREFFISNRGWVSETEARQNATNMFETSQMNAESRMINDIHTALKYDNQTYLNDPNVKQFMQQFEERNGHSVFEVHPYTREVLSEEQQPKPGQKGTGHQIYATGGTYTVENGEVVVHRNGTTVRPNAENQPSNEEQTQQQENSQQVQPLFSSAPNLTPENLANAQITTNPNIRINPLTPEQAKQMLENVPDLTNVEIGVSEFNGDLAPSIPGGNQRNEQPAVGR